MVMSPRAASQLYLPTLITFISFNNTSTPALLPQLGATLQEFLGTMQGRRDEGGMFVLSVPVERIGRRIGDPRSKFLDHGS